MEITKLPKKSNKKYRKFLQPKALSKSNEPKKPIDDPSEEEQKAKKSIKWCKKDHCKSRKKVTKTSQPKKEAKSPEFLDTDSDEV